MTERRARVALRSIAVLAVICLQSQYGLAAVADDSAEELYARAVELFESRQASALAESADLFEKVIRLEPRHALAFSGLAANSCLQALYSLAPPREVMPRARRSAAAAVELDPGLAQPYASLALVAFLFDWDWRRAEELFLRSFEKDPTYAQARHWYAMLLTARRRFDEAVEQIDEAQRLDPGSRIITVKRGTVLTAAGHFASAEEQLRLAIERFPRMALPWRELGFLRLRQGRLEDAVENFERAAGLGGGASKSSGGLGYVYGRVGREEESWAILEDFVERSQSSFVPPLYVALMYVGLDEPETALDWLEKAMEIRDPGLVYLGVKPGYESLQGGVRFQELLRTVGMD